MPGPLPTAGVGTIATLKPFWTQPATNGLLSNKYGATKETLILRNPAKNPAGMLNVQAVRQSDGATIWDSGWVGRPATQYPPAPAGGPAGMADFGLAPVANGAGVLFIGGAADATHFAKQTYAAQPAAGSLGGWTPSRAMPGTNRAGVYAFYAKSAQNEVVIPQALSSIAGSAVTTYVSPTTGQTTVYVLGGYDANGNLSSSGWYATLNPDGTLASDWVALPNLIAYNPATSSISLSGVAYAAACVAPALNLGPAGTTVGPSLLITGGIVAGLNAGGGIGGTPSGWGAYLSLNFDGTPSAAGWGNLAPQLAVAGNPMLNYPRYGHAMVATVSGGLFVIGGYGSNSNASSPVPAPPVEWTYPYYNLSQQQVVMQSFAVLSAGQGGYAPTPVALAGSAMVNWPGLAVADSYLLLLGGIFTPSTTIAAASNGIALNPSTTIAAASNGGRIEARNTAADGTTTAGSLNIVSATAAFTQSDVGRTVSGGSLGAGRTIATVTDATHAAVSGTTAGITTASGVTFSIGPILKVVVAATGTFRPTGTITVLSGQVLTYGSLTGGNTFNISSVGTATGTLATGGAVTAQTTVIDVVSNTSLAASGTTQVQTSAGLQTVTYAGKSGSTQLTGVNGGSGTMSTGGTVLQTGADATTIQWTTIGNDYFFGLLYNTPPFNALTWHTHSVSLPAADSRGGAFLGYSHGQLTLYYVTGHNGQARVYSAPVTVGTYPTASITIGSWSYGPASSALATGDMGTGGSVVANPNGSQDLQFQYGGAGSAAAENPAAGDTIIFTATVVDSVSGDTSPPSDAAAVLFGDPPSISALAGSPANNGDPTLSFTFSPGTGGQLEKSWSLTLTDPGANTLVDSGAQVGQANSWNAVPATPLQNGTTYTVHALAQSLDLPYPGSSAQATATAPYTPTLTPLGTPTGFTATPDGANGLIAFAWTNPASTALSRIWYRPSGFSTWRLLKNVAVGAGAQTVSLMDEIALNTLYDFCVTAVNASNAESALGDAGATASSVILKPAVTPGKSPQSWSLMLHFAGVGPSAGNHLALVPVPAGTFHVAPDTQVQPVYGAQQPLARYGVNTPISYDAGDLYLPSSQRPALEAFLLKAQQQALPVYVRDVLGNIFVAAVGERQYDWEQDGAAAAANVPTPYSERASLKLVAINYQYSA